MAPTTLLGQRTTTSVNGRDAAVSGNPANILALLNTFDTVKYLARGSVHSPAAINRTKKYIHKALENQLHNVGYSFVEILAPCPTNWKMTPLQSLEHMKTKVLAQYPLGEVKTGAPAGQEAEEA